MYKKEGTKSAAEFSKEILVVKEEEKHDAGVFKRVKAEVVKLLKEPINSPAYKIVQPTIL